MKKYSSGVFGLGFLLLIALTWFGCAGTPHSNSTQPAIFVSSKEPAFIGLPTIPDSIETVLAHIGWGSGRFVQELRKELIYQFNQKGIATLNDSVGAKSTLFVTMGQYVEVEGSSSSFGGEALLKTSQGEKKIPFTKTEKRASTLERPDPTVDNIRLIAETIVSASRKQPPVRRVEKSDPTPQILMVF